MYFLEINKDLRKVLRNLYNGYWELMEIIFIDVEEFKNWFLCVFLKLLCFFFMIKEGINDLKFVIYDVDDKICVCYLDVYFSLWYLIVVIWLKRGVGIFYMNMYWFFLFIKIKYVKFMIIYCVIFIFYLYLFCICLFFL